MDTKWIKASFSNGMGFIAGIAAVFILTKMAQSEGGYLMAFAGIKKNPFGESGFPGVNMRHDSDIAGSL